MCLRSQRIQISSWPVCIRDGPYIYNAKHAPICHLGDAVRSMLLTRITILTSLCPALSHCCTCHTASTTAYWRNCLDQAQRTTCFLDISLQRTSSLTRGRARAFGKRQHLSTRGHFASKLLLVNISYMKKSFAFANCKLSPVTSINTNISYSDRARCQEWSYLALLPSNFSTAQSMLMRIWTSMSTTIIDNRLSCG